MALSQIQCLDDNHINPRTHESKPEFLYCEEQRLAIEALLRDGREAFVKYLEARGVRGFLSDLERDALTAAAEPFDPGSEIQQPDADAERTPLSLQYWPELSDTSVPQMDLGWPSCDSYRGVTRTSVYTQPPLEGQAHIKEVVRKMIAQAQKVIAVVMDVFTDVDIFRDLLDAGFKRKVSVYILLERTTLPHFLSMCQRASMHAGHLKHLRVCCTGGSEFYTRHCTKVAGRMGHRFMFIDGDKAVSGSYSFTWMSSRMDRHLVTVTTGQAVDAFDQLFRLLYMTSRVVDLRKVATEPEPEADSRPQVASVIPPSSAVARKLHNPKYALVALTNPCPTTSVGNDSPKEPKTSEKAKKERRRLSEDTPPLHPGLTNLEKADLIPYLPIWPEPDPPKDVIGFINIRDNTKSAQVHLQRSERFETSQAIKFSSPLSQPQQPLPEVATPRQITNEHEEMNKLLSQNESKTKELVVDTSVPGHNKSEDKASEQTSPPCSQKAVPHGNETKALKAENKLCSNTAINPYADHDTPDTSQDTSSQTSNKAPSSNKEEPSNKAETVSAISPKADLLKLSPLNKPQEMVPEGVVPRQTPVKHEKMNKLQPEQNGPKANELLIDGTASGSSKCKDKAPEQNSCSQKSGLDNDETILKLCLDTAINPDTVHDTRKISSNISPPSSHSSDQKLSFKSAETVYTTFLKSNTLTESEPSPTNGDNGSIKFGSPPSQPQETFSEVAVSKKTYKLQPLQNELTTKEFVMNTSALDQNQDKHKEPDQKSPPGSQKTVPDKDETKVLKTEDKRCSNRAINLSHDTHVLSPKTLPQFSTKVPSSNKEKSSSKDEINSTTNLQSDSDELKPKELVVDNAVPGHNKDKDKALDQELTQYSQISVPDKVETKVLKMTNEVTVAKQITGKHEEMNKLQPVQNEPKAKELILIAATPGSNKSEDKAPEQNSALCSQKTVPDKGESKGLKTENRISSSIAMNTDEGHNTPELSSNTSSQSGNKAPLSYKESHFNKANTSFATSSKLDSNESKPKHLVVDTASPRENKNKDKAGDEKSCSQNFITDQNETKVLETENKLHLSTTIDSDVSHDSSDLFPHSSNKTPSSNNKIPSDKGKTVSKTSLKSESFTKLTSEKETKTLNTQSTAVDIVHTLKSNSAQTSILENLPHSNAKNTVVSDTESHTTAINMQPKVSSEVTHNLRSPIGLGHSPCSSSSPTQSEASTSINNSIMTPIAGHSSTASIPSRPSSSSHSSLPSSTSSFTTQPSLTSSASSFLYSFPPVPKPRTVHLVLKDSSNQKSQMLSEITGSPASSEEVSAVHSVPPLTSTAQISSVKRVEGVTEGRNSSASIGRAQRETENQTKFNNTLQQKQCASSQEKKLKEEDSQLHSVTGTKLKMQSDLLITDALKTASANTQEIIPKDVDSKILILTDSKTCSDLEKAAQTEENMTNCEHANFIQPQTYFARSHEPQKILFSKVTSPDLVVLEGTESLKTQINDTTQRPYIFKDGVDDRIGAGNALRQPSEQTQVCLKQTDTHITFYDQTQTSTDAPEKPLDLDFSFAQAATSKSPNTKQNPKLAAAKAPTSDVFPSCSLTPDSQKASPDSRLYMLDFRSPTSDTSEGYFSPKEDSTFSNTSDEFYQCCDSPLDELVMDSADCHNYEKMDDHTNTSSTTTDPSPVHLISSTTAATAGTADQNTSNNEVGLLSKATEVASSLPPINSQKSEPKEDSDANDKEEAIQMRKRTTEKMNQETQWTGETDNQEAIRIIKHLQDEDDLAETVAKGNEAQSFKQNRAIINSAADNVVDKRVTGSLTTGQEMEPKQLSTSDLKPEEVSSGDRPEKTSSKREEAPNQGSRNIEEMRGRPSTRETKGRKVFSDSPTPERNQKRGNGPPSSSRPVRSHRPLSGSLVSGAHPSGSQTESRVFYSGFNVSDKTSSPRRRASRSPAPLTGVSVRSVASRKQVSHLSQQPPAAQIRSRSDQSQFQAPLHKGSSRYTHSNPQPQVSPQGLIPKESEQAAPEQQEGRAPFNLSFRSFYNFRGLRDKWTKPPTQSRKSSTGAPAKEHKSTS